MKKIAIAAALLLVLLAAGAVALALLLPAGKVRALAAAKAGEALGAEVSIDDARLSLVPPGIRLSGVTVGGRTAGDPPLLVLDEGRVSFRLLPLLARRVEISRVDARGAAITVVKEPAREAPPAGEGQPGGAAREREEGEKEGGSSFLLLLSSARLAGVTLRVLDRETGKEYVAGPLDAETSLRAGGRSGAVSANGTMRIDAVHAPELVAAGYGDGFERIDLSYDVRYLPAGGVAEIGSLRLRHERLDLLLAGRVSGLPASPEGTLAIETEEIDLSDLLSLLPPAASGALERFEGSGPVSPAGEFSFRGDEPPSFRLAARLGGVEIRNRDHAGPLRDVRGEIELTPGAVRIDVKTRRIDFDAFLPPEEEEEEGEGKEEKATARGGAEEAGTAGPPVVLPPLPPIDLAGRVVAETLITGGALLTGAVADVDLAGGGGAIRLAIESGAFGRVLVREGKGDLEVGAEGIDGLLSMKSAVAYGVPFATVRGRLALRPRGEIRLDSLRGRVFDGAVAGDVRVSLTPGKAPRFRIRAKAEEIEVNDFLSRLTPARDLLFGRFSLESSWEGEGLEGESLARSLVAEGTMRGGAGRLVSPEALRAAGRLVGATKIDTIRFREMWSSFRVAAGRVRFDRLEIHSADADWRADGSIGFDGSLDYALSVTLSEALSRKYREKSSLTSLLAGADRRIVLDFRVTGTAKKPAVSLDLSKAVRRAGLPDTGGLIESLEKNERARGVIDDLLGGKKNPLQGLFGGGKKGEAAPDSAK